ncbi:MAG: MFS transporter [Anaerolineales bacterium]
MAIKDRFPALASRDFLIFWVGQFVSLIGTWMQNTTQPYLAYRITGSSLDLGLIAFSSTVPTLLLALPGGVLIERGDKRKIVISMQVIMMAQAFILAFLALTGRIQIWQIIGLSFVLGSASTIEVTARQAMLIELVGKPALPNAIALQSTIFNLARVIGPSFTAIILILIKNQGEAWAFFANGVSFLFVIVGLFFVRTPYRIVKYKPSKEKLNLSAEFKEGWNYIHGNTVTLLIIILVALIGFFGFPFSNQIPAIARDVLSRIADTEESVAARTGALYIAQGVGALVAALFISVFSTLRRKGLLMSLGQFVFSVFLVLFALAHSLPLAITLICVLGWATVTQLMLMNILIQLDVPDELRGRVYSVYLWAQQGVAPFGSLFFGGLAQTAGVPRATLVCGCICLLVVVLIHAKWPILRQKIA